MQPDSAREVEDAILAVTPTDVDGLVPVGMHLVDGYPITEWGNPRPVAERQAAAARPVIYREAADLIDCDCDPDIDICPTRNAARNLRDLADKLTEEGHHAN